MVDKYINVSHDIVRVINRIIAQKPSNMVLEERVNIILMDFKNQMKKEILSELRQEKNKHG